MPREETEREAKSVPVVAGMIAGVAAGAAIGGISAISAVAAGPVGVVVVVGATLVAIAGAVRGKVVGTLRNPKDSSDGKLFVDVPLARPPA